MTKKRTEDEKLIALIDALSDSVLEASDEEILEEIQKSGIDIDSEATRLKAMMLATVKSFKQKNLKAARVEYNHQINKMENKPYTIPNTEEGRRKLFILFSQHSQNEKYVTAQYRNLEKLTDNDIKSFLEDLADLGVLQKFENNDKDGEK